MSKWDDLSQVHLPCPRCDHENMFEAAEITGPLGIFCEECGSSFDRALLATIRRALEHKPAHARSAAHFGQGKFTDNVHAPNSNAGRSSSSGWDLR